MRAARVQGLLPLRDTAQMRADPDHDEPFVLLHARAVGLGIDEVGGVVRLGPGDLLGGAAQDEHWPAAPGHRDPLADLDRPDVHVGGCERKHVGRRVQAVDERPGGGRG